MSRQSSVKGVRSLKTRLLLGLAGVCAPLAGYAQVFVQAGPSPETGPPGLANGADGPNNRPAGTAPSAGTQSGAVQSVAIDPFNSSLILVGTTNGGIWRSADGGVTWAAETDNKGSLSIGGVSFDTTDKTGKTAIAGIGVTSAGATYGVGGGSPVTYFDLSRGGSTNNGLLYTTDGGLSWATIGKGALPDIGIINVTARGSVIMAAAFNEEGAWTNGNGVEAASGLYRSTDGGTTFTKLGAGAGLPVGAATALIGDPNNPLRFYTAIASANPNVNYADTALYTTIDGGATWSKVFGATNAPGIANNGDPTILRVSTAANGAVAVGVVDGFTGNLLYAYLSKDYGGTWNDLSVALDPNNPNPTNAGPKVNGFTNALQEAPIQINAGGQASIHSAIAIDPNNTNIVYLAGDRLANPGVNGYSANALRATLNADGSVTYSLLTDSFTSDGSTAHPDVRALTFDSKGNLYLGTDGGVYYRTLPQTNNGAFYGLNAGRQNLEVYSLALDPNTGLLAVAAQDNGAALQSAKNSPVYNIIQGGDGTVAAINGKTLAGGLSYAYVAAQYLNNGDLLRYQFGPQSTDANQNPVQLFFVDQSGNGIQIDQNTVLFKPTLKLNNIDPSLIALGVFPGVLTTQDTFATPLQYVFPDGSVALYNNLVTNFAGATGYVTALDYGTKDNTYALLAGSTRRNGARLFVSTGTTADTISLKPVYSYTALSYNGNPALAPTSVLFDPRSQNRFFAADTNLLYGTIDGGVTGKLLNSNLPTTFTRPETLGFISSNGVNALLVGGLNTTDNAGNPLVIADSDANGLLSNWRRFGSGLPNTQVTALDYEAALDTLAVGTFGRGTFLLYDVTSNFAAASVLQFGLANNDSNPDVAILTGSRPLIKYGTGTLTLAGSPTFVGNVTLKGGLTQISSDTNLGASSNSLIFDGGGLRTLAAITSARSLTINGGNGLIDTNGFNSSFSGNAGGVGALIKAGLGTLTLGGANTYQGGTAILGGELALPGTLGSSVYIGAAGTLSGSGAVLAPVSISGGVIRPGGTVGANGSIVRALVAGGSSSSSLTVGQLTSLAGGTLAVGYGSTGSTALNVLGGATITGMTLQATQSPGATLGFDQRYIVLQSSKLTGQFTNLSSFAVTNPANPLSYQRVRYDLVANSAVLEVLNRVDWTQSATTPNGLAAGQVFNGGQFTASDKLITALNGVYGLSASDRATNLETVSGGGNLNTLALDQAVQSAFMGAVSDHMFGGASGGQIKPKFAQTIMHLVDPGAQDMAGLVSAAEEGGSSHPSSSRGAIWGQAYYADDTVRSAVAPNALHAAGVATGFDARIGTANSRIGLAVGYANGKTTTLADGVSGKADFWQGAAYASDRLGPWFFGVAASYQLGDQNLTRNSVLLGSGAAVNANSKTFQTDWSLAETVGRDVALKRGWKVTISGTLNYQSHHQDAYREVGDGTLSLNLAPVNQRQLWSDVALKLSHRTELQHGSFTPYIGVSERNLLEGDQNPGAFATFQALPNTPFVIHGQGVPEAQTRLDVGFDSSLSSRIDVGVRYEGVVSGGLRENLAAVSVTARW